MAVTVFFSYSHKDEALRDKVAEHLSALKRSNIIQAWHDRQILPGTEWKDEIDRNLRTADIILLLVSASQTRVNSYSSKYDRRSNSQHRSTNNPIESTVKQTFKP